MASLRATIVLLIALGVGAVGAGAGKWPITHVVAPILGLLALNLAAAMVAHQRLRTDPTLAALHLSLIALLLVTAVSRLTYFDGIGSVSVGAEFDGEVVAAERGPWHPAHPADLRFSNLGFREHFDAAGRYVSTINRVGRESPDGSMVGQDIGDDLPLIAAGYRVYVSPSRGYSPILAWRGQDGRENVGSVQLPDARHTLAPIRPIVGRDAVPDPFLGQQTTLPDGRTEAWIKVNAESSAPPPGTVRDNLGTRDLPHTLTVRIGENRWTLNPGDSIDLPNGQLKYLWLDAWLGYRIVRDPFAPWLFACGLIAAVSLGVHYLRAFRSNSWQKEA